MKQAWFSLIGLSLALFAVGCTKPASNNGPCGSGQAQCNGACIDVQSDSQNCGTCGYTCDTGQACQAGVCVCAQGFVSCSGMCVASNTDHCGSTCMACASGQVCDNGQCSSAGCGSGSMMCTDGACSSNTDSGHCGTSCAVCPVGASCSNGACNCTVAGQQNCNGTCVDTSTSSGNCGSCGNACPFGDSCVNGACMGASTGGSTGTGGSGSGTGGTTGNGGSGSGGTSPTGGSTGSGGSGNGGSTGTGGQSNQPTLITSANNAFWKTTGTLSLASGNPSPTVTVTSTAKQTWEGFGGAFNELGWKYIQMLSASDQAKVLDLLFGTDAAHFGIGRIPIGASDYAIQRYSEDETSGDTSMTHFSISEDMNYLIPYAKAAQQVNPGLRFWASPWTPPTWMKTTSGSAQGTSCALVGSTMFDGGCMNASSANLTAYAKYLQMFVQAYAASSVGINIDTVSPQNEPSYAQGYPSCLWNPTDYVSFVKTYLGPAFSGSSTKVMLGTMSNGDNGQQSHDLIIQNDVTGDGTAKGFEKVIGLQWGMLDIYEQNPSWMTGTSGMSFWATEHKCGNYPWNPSGFPKYVEPAPNDLAYGVESWGYISKAIRAGVTSYNAWNMVLDTVGKGNDTARQWSQDSLLVVNTSTKVLTITPAYYVFRHCAQYVQIGAQVLNTTGGDAIAWKNPDGSTVAVMYNSGSATTYTVSIAGKLVQFAMPAAGWATVVMPAGI